VNGRNIQSFDTNGWRNLLGCVPQEVKIFNGNLLFNITLTDEAKEFETAINFCQEFGFEKYFQGFPQGYLTLLGEDGVNISGGQKQLVGLARALYNSPQVLLLDEATSAMDKNTERFVLDLLESLKPKMATLFITHRNDTANFCDRILELEQGKVEIAAQLTL
jgi:ATP-binding cassette subfamily B protein